MKRAWELIQRNSLWLVGLGVMAASSGVDGAYMSAWMPDGAGWLGYVLNTTSDAGSEVLMYWFGRLRQERKGSKKHRLSLLLLPAEIVIVAFSWFFSWRQLLRVLGPVEGAQARWVAPVSAAFAPVLLASIGYAQALLAGKFEFTKETHQETEETQEEAQETAQPTWAEMSKAERILYLSDRQPDLTQSEIAGRADCSDGYVSKVLSSQLAGGGNGR